MTNQRPAQERDRLAEVLSAAAAPGREDELAGEQTVLAAFTASRQSAARQATAEEDQPRAASVTSKLAKVFASKVAAFVLVGSAAGGAAFAASGVLPNPFSGSAGQTPPVSDPSVPSTEQAPTPKPSAPAQPEPADEPESADAQDDEHESRRGDATTENEVSVPADDEPREPSPQPSPSPTPAPAPDLPLPAPDDLPLPTLPEDDADLPELPDAELPDGDSVLPLPE